MSDRRHEVAVVFGGSGFIGTHLTRHLVHSGYDVVIADLRPPARAAGSRVRFQPLDVRRRICLAGIDKADVVYNLAAVHRTPGHADRDYYDTNVAGAINITNWCSEVAATQLLFTSSISVYGPTEVRKDETSPPTPDSAYGRSKLLAEAVHRQWSSAGSRRLAIARPAVVYGPGEAGNFTRLAQAMARRRFAYPGRDDTVKACGYVTDLVRALAFAQDRPEANFVFNYCYPRQHTLREICEAFQHVAGYKAPPLIPRALVQAGLRTMPLLALTGADPATNAERVAKVTASTNIAPRVLTESGFRWQTDLESSLRLWHAADPAGAFV